MIKVANLISDLIGDNQLYNRAVQNLKNRARLPYIYNPETYSPDKWQKAFDNLPITLDLGFLPFISMALTKLRFNYLNLLFINLRHAVRK